LNAGIFCVRRCTQTIETLEEWISRPMYDTWFEQRTINDMYGEEKFRPWIREIDPKWNDLTYHRYSEKPIVLACHGSNTPDFKYMIMVKDVLNSYGWPAKKGA